jgi:MFS family permease
MSDELERETIEADVIAETPEVAETLSVFRRTFVSLYHRDFLLFWGGAWLSNIGTWLQTIALGWLVLQMTNSSFYLGLVNFTSTIPVFALSFAAGIYTDRHDKRWLIVGTQIVAMLLAFLLGALITLRIQTIPSILVISFAGGITFAFSFPAWQAIISEIIPRKNLLNAIALNSAQFHAARLLGPALAGFIIAAYGMAAPFYLNGISFLAVIAALLFIQYEHKPRETRRSGWVEFREGFLYAWQNKVVLYLLLGVGMLSVFGISFYSVLMPVFARDILRGGPTTLGFLMGANGFGALMGAVAVAYVAHFVRRSTLIKYGMIVFSISLVLFAFSRLLSLSLPILAVAGFAFMMVNSTINTTLQSIVPHRMRGRIMSFFVWMFMGQMPLGSLLAGSLAHYLGAPTAVTLAALVPLSTAIYLFFSFPKFEES